MPAIRVGPRTFGDPAEATVVGQVEVSASDVDIDGFSLTNPNVPGSAIGILVKSTGSGSTIHNNILEHISSTATGIQRCHGTGHLPGVRAG